MRKLHVVILCLLMTQAIVAQTKIVVLSDLHLMAPTLLVKDGPAWRDLLADSRTLLDFSQPLCLTSVSPCSTRPLSVSRPSSRSWC